MRRFQIALLVVLATGGAGRLLSATLAPLVYDEYQWIAVADRVSFVPFHLPLHGDAHPPGAAYLAALGASVLGHNLVGYRSLSVALGIALIWLTWRLGARAFGERVGLLGAALVAGNEYLLGVSRLATEEGAYLTLSLATLLAFLRAVDKGGMGRYVLAGLLFGLALLTKETMALWAPLLLWELVARRGRQALREPGPWIAGLVAIVVMTPDLIWNLYLRIPSDDLANRGLAFQLSRLGPGWSFGPTALFLRPVGLATLENAVSEYPAMTCLPGGLLLLGAIGSLAVWKNREVRMLLRLGWVPFLFFTLLGNSKTASVEFWWSDLSIVPFALLTAALLGRCPVPFSVAAILLTLPGSVSVSAARENCYPPSWPAPGPALERCREAQRAFVAIFPERDHAALCRLGPLRLPAARFYERAFEAYLSRLRSGPTASGDWPDVPPERHAAEVARAGRMLESLRAP